MLCIDNLCKVELRYDSCPLLLTCIDPAKECSDRKDFLEHFLNLICLHFRRKKIVFSIFLNQLFFSHIVEAVLIGFIVIFRERDMFHSCIGFYGNYEDMRTLATWPEEKGVWWFEFKQAFSLI